MSSAGRQDRPLPLLAGLIGWPVAQSKSPLIHEYWLRQMGIDGHYVRLPVRPGEVARAFRGMVALGFTGIQATMPHKRACFDLVDHHTPAAKALGAVNTVIQTIQLGVPIARVELIDHNTVRMVNAYAKLGLREEPMLLMEFHGSAAGARTTAWAGSRRSPRSSPLLTRLYTSPTSMWRGLSMRPFRASRWDTRKSSRGARPVAPPASSSRASPAASRFSSSQAPKPSSRNSAALAG